MDSPTRALVAYATAAGSTSGVAECIATVLRDAGADVVCRPVGPDLDPAGHDVVVVGSAVHDMAWLPPALEFLRRAAATGAPVWCFSVGGLAHPDRGRGTRWLAAGERKRIAQGFPPSFRPRDHALFSGVVEVSSSPLWGRLFYRLTGGRDGDHRDWAAIRSWAQGVAAALPGRPAGTATPGPDPT